MMACCAGRLDDKVIVLAGGAGGIGSSTARRLALEGASVVVGDLNLAEAQEIASSIHEQGGKATAAPLDISDHKSVANLIELSVKTYGKIDGVHVNAAALSDLHRDTNALDIDLDYWDYALGVDLSGYLYCTKHALPHLLANGGGSLIYTSSEAAFAGEDQRVCYASAKAAVNALMRHVARKWGKQGVRANSIAPGLVLSPATGQLPEEFLSQALESTSSTRLGKTDDIAAMVAHLMSEDGYWIQGQVISINGGALMR